MKNILRWLGILPIAIFAAIAVTAIAQWCTCYTLDLPAEDLPIILDVEKNIIWGYIFVSIGSLIAPKYNKQVSLVLGTILIVLAITGAISALEHEGFSGWLVLDVFVLIIGVIIGIGVVHNDMNSN